MTFYFIVRSLEVMRGAFHDFDSDIGGILKVFSQPDSRKVSPAKLLNENIAIVENFSDVAGMVAK